MAMLAIICWLLLAQLSACSCRQNFVVVTVQGEITDRFNRFMRSAKVNNIDVDILKKQEGSNKDEIIRNGVAKYKNEKNMIVMVIDTQNIIFTSDVSDVVLKFKSFNTSLVISSEDFSNSGLVETPSLGDRLLSLEEDGYRYLCPAVIIGYASVLYDIISIKGSSNDRQRYTDMFISARENYSMKLDGRAELFQNLNGVRDDVEVNFHGGEPRVKNVRFKTEPVVVFDTDERNVFINHIGNYLPNQWSQREACWSCSEDRINLADFEERNNWPTVLLVVDIPTLTPFLGPFLHQISNLDYPKERIDVFIHNGKDHHTSLVLPWVRKSKKLYNSVTYKPSSLHLDDQETKNKAIRKWRELKTDYFLFIDNSVSLTNSNTLKLLIAQNRSIIAPMMSKYQKLWSNFWGDLSSDGFYARSEDYLEIVKGKRKGVWNSPYMSHIYLINRSVIDKIMSDPYSSPNMDTDMQFCDNLRKSGLFMYVTNMGYYGHLKEMGTYKTEYKHNDLYQLFDNKLDWEDKYLHSEYSKTLAKDSVIPMPCPDVYWVPIATESFVTELIEECEHYGKWSGGKDNYKDDRIAGGYENVPTVDIHMKQIGFEKHWLKMLKDYFSPMASRIFTGYYSENKAYMNFVVKYSLQPGGQYFLRPHHDASTYTINMALNRAGIDYQGGGVRFLRYNCSVSDTKRGWALLNPGRLTHQHEGLPITGGQRYIMISFVDP